MSSIMDLLNEVYGPAEDFASAQSDADAMGGLVFRIVSVGTARAVYAAGRDQFDARRRAVALGLIGKDEVTRVRATTL